MVRGLHALITIVIVMVILNYLFSPLFLKGGIFAYIFNDLVEFSFSDLH